MKARSVTLLCVVLAVIYFFAFARGTGRELVVAPKSLITLESMNSPSAQNESVFLPIQGSFGAGFVDEEHELVSYYVSDRIALDREWVAIHRGDILELLKPTGQIISRFAGSPLPIARDGNLYLYADDSGTLSKIDPANGARIWERNYISQLTSIDARIDRTLVGFLDGRIELIDNLGKVLLSYRPGGSGTEVIYGAVISNGASKIALISGLRPQRFLILEERGSSFRPIHHHNTNSDYRRPIAMEFIRDDRQVLYEGGEGIEIFDVKKGRLNEREISGNVFRWIDNLMPKTLTILEEDEGGARIKMLAPDNLPLFDFALPSGTVDIVKDRNFMIIVGQYDILVLELSLQ